MSAAAPSVTPPPDERVTVVKASTSFFSLNLRELWAYRELLAFLVWRDVKVRYKQTAIGGLWAIIQPTIQMIVFSIIFGRLANLDSEGVPYPLFAYAGLLPWLYFASSLSQTSSSVLSNSGLITKVYFPRLIVPLNAVAVPIVDFLLASTVLGALFAFYGRLPSWHIVALPGFLLLALLTSFGAGLWLSALAARYRDVPFALPFLVQLWFFSSPVVYSVTLIPERWHWLYSLNPMVGVLDGFRWALLDREAPDPVVLLGSATAAVLLVLSGLVFFKRIERRFADII